MDDKPTFGTLLKRQRRSAHMTQDDLARRAGYSSHYVSMLERGVRSPQPLTIDLLADALELQEMERAALHAAMNGQQPFVPSQRVPPHTATLIGRGGDIALIVHTLLRADVRLLSLTGPGGAGKTVLSHHVAASLAPSFRHGVAFIDLSAVSDHEEVIPAIARALALRAMTGQSVHERLTAYLQDREMLLVLDNFERVVEAAASVANLLAPCPRLKVLVTSRTLLRLRTEHEFRVQPLALPGPEDAHTAARLLKSPAVALFVQRAWPDKDDLEIDDEQAVMIADICHRVDGLPLAIELAAARVGHIPLPTLCDRLQHRLQILTGGMRDLPVRQQHMRDTIAWSYDLLTRRQQDLFSMLSVFAGSWSLEAAEQVCRRELSDGDVIDELRSLVESSLVIPMDQIQDQPRYRMLDTIHEYAAEQLASAGERDAACNRHSAYFLHLAEEAEPGLQDRDQHVWYTRLEREHDNLRAALRRFLDTNDAESALRLAGAIWRFWQHRGDIREGRRWLDEGLSLEGHVSARVRAKALWGASWLAYYQGDYSRTESLSVEHLSLAEQLGDALITRNALTGLGMAALAEGRYADAVQLLGDALDACRSLGNIWHLATSLLNVGNASMLAGDLAQASSMFEEALALYQERGDDVFTARTRQHLGYVALLQSEYARAQTLFVQSLEALFNLGEMPGVADGLEGVAAVRAATGSAQQAGQLVEVAGVLRERIGVTPLMYLQPLWQPWVARAEASLGEIGWAAAREGGRALPLREAVALAAGRDEPEVPVAPDHPHD